MGNLRSEEEFASHLPPVGVRQVRQQILRGQTAIGRHRVKRIGYEPALISCEAFRSLESRLPAKASLVAAGGSVERMRMVKSPSEIDRIRRSVLAARAADVAEISEPVCIVSSGAIALGLPLLGMTRRPRSTPQLQAASAAGRWPS